jgi:acrylyl-CoA reductase (NADPH)
VRIENIQIGRDPEKPDQIAFHRSEIDSSALFGTQIIVENEISSLNFKDKFVWRGERGFDRGEFLPLGFDGVGKVIWSGPDSKITLGSRVLFFAQDGKLKTQGGFQRFSIHNSEKTVHLCSLRSADAITLGVPGFTALAALQLALNQNPKPVRVLITGSTGNVGLMAVKMFRTNFEVVEEVNVPRHFSSASMDRLAVLQMPLSQLMPERWDFVLDTLGGPILGSASRFVSTEGTLVSAGNVLGSSSTIPLAPLFARGVTIQGLNLTNLVGDNGAKLLTAVENLVMPELIASTRVEYLTKDSLFNFLNKTDWPSGTRALVLINDLLQELN